MAEQTAETVNPKYQYESEEHAKADRDFMGRFMAGNPGGPGNPHNRQIAAFKRAILSATTTDEAKTLARKIYDMAMEGNLAAAKIYFTYTVGKPDNPIDPDRVAVHEIELYRDTKSIKDEKAPFIEAGRAESHLHLVRTLQPVVAALQNDQIMSIMRQTPEERKKKEAEARAKMNERLDGPAPELPDGLEEKLWPTANGGIPEELPSALTGYGERPTSNGVNRRGKRKKKRNGMAKPSANGRNHFEPNGRG